MCRNQYELLTIILTNNTIADIDGKLEKLQQQLLQQAKSKNDYNEVADEIYRLRELKQNVMIENAEREGRRQRIDEMTEFLITSPTSWRNMMSNW